MTLQTYKEKSEVLNSCCASDSKYSSHVTQAEKGKSRNWENEDLIPTKPTVEEYKGQGDLRNLSVHKSMGTAWVLRVAGK